MLESPRVVTLPEIASRYAESGGAQVAATYKVVASIRRKLNRLQPGLMQTVHRVGYRIADPVSVIGSQNRSR